MRLKLTRTEWISLSKATGIHLCKAIGGMVEMTITAAVSITMTVCQAVNKAMASHPKVCCAGLTIVFAIILLLTYAQMKVTNTSLTYERDSLQIQIDSVKARGGLTSYPKIQR